MRRKDIPLLAALIGGFGIIGGLGVIEVWHQDKAQEAVQNSDRFTPGTKKVSPEPRKKTCLVERVVDGDTVKLSCEYPEGLRLVTVRIIGIDAPELRDKKTGKPQCYALKAKQEAERLLPHNSRADIVQDVTQAPEDRYGRVLAYVTARPDDYGGIDLGWWLVRHGYAQEYTYDRPYARQSDYKGLQEVADQESRGMWGACTW